MRRKIVDILLVLVCFILQCTVFKKLSLASISPNLLIVVTSSFGFMRGKKEGMYVGAFSGLLMDIFFGDFIGFYTLIYMYIGYMNGFFHKIFFDEDVKLPMVLITASEFLYGLIIYCFLFLLRWRWDFTYYLLHIIVPELVYTVVVTIILYRVILVINRRLEEVERRSESKFV